MKYQSGYLRNLNAIFAGKPHQGFLKIWGTQSLFILKSNYLKAKYILRQTLTFFFTVMFLHVLSALNKIPV